LTWLKPVGRGREEGVVGIYATKARWQRAIRPLVEAMVARRVHPDVFTYSALALSLLAGVALWRAGTHSAWLWLVPPCVLLRLLLNLFDGQVARALGLADAWGEVKNEFGDRLADSAIFLGLAFGGYASAALAALALALILCVAYLGLLGKAVGGQRLYGGVFGKGDRMLALALFTLYPLLSANLYSYDWFLGGAALAALVTIVQRLRGLYAATRSVR
jgi:CDP-diacylglycerol---glycerol-3-phosphate 3-phosphatidyltransferase